MKQCTKCLRVKEPSQFNKRSASSDGLHPQCKQCRSDYRVKNAAKIAAQKKAWADANQDHVKERSRRYYEENKEEVLTRNRRYYESVRHTEEFKARARAAAKRHRAAHPEKIKARLDRWRHNRDPWEVFYASTWSSINGRTVNGCWPQFQNERYRYYFDKGVEVRLSRVQYRDWCESQAGVIDLIIANGDTPSIDRIDPDGHYELGNIRVIPLKLNLSRKPQ